jgi:hypothetical protein
MEAEAGSIAAMVMAAGIALAAIIVFTAGRQLLDLSRPDAPPDGSRRFARRLLYRLVAVSGVLAAAGYMLY